MKKAELKMQGLFVRPMYFVVLFEPMRAFCFVFCADEGLKFVCVCADEGSYIVIRLSFVMPMRAFLFVVLLRR
jgi:hypothetical protein